LFAGSGMLLAFSWHTQNWRAETGKTKLANFKKRLTFLTYDSRKMPRSGLKIFIVQPFMQSMSTMFPNVREEFPVTMN